MSEQQPCGGRLCMDGVGVDCIYTCMSKTQLQRATAAPITKAAAGQAFPARYEGRCPDCKGRIHEGDPVVWNPAGAGKGVVHEGCV